MWCYWPLIFLRGPRLVAAHNLQRDACKRSVELSTVLGWSVMQIFDQRDHSTGLPLSFTLSSMTSDTLLSLCCTSLELVLQSRVNLNPIVTGECALQRGLRAGSTRVADDDLRSYDFRRTVHPRTASTFKYSYIHIPYQSRGLR